MKMSEKDWELVHQQFTQTYIIYSSHRILQFFNQGVPEFVNIKVYLPNWRLNTHYLNYIWSDGNCTPRKSGSKGMEKTSEGGISYAVFLFIHNNEEFKLQIPENFKTFSPDDADLIWYYSWMWTCTQQFCFWTYYVSNNMICFLDEDLTSKNC